MDYRKDILKLIKNKNLMTKVFVYMSSASAGDDYDEFENNLVYSSLNPICIKAYVRELTPEQAFYKQYGISQDGMKEIICKEKWRTAFEKCNKIVIDNIIYQVFKSGGGNKTLITKRPYRMLRVVLSRLD